jgi:predicted alpha/beta-hydrolase family hydrolase
MNRNSIICAGMRLILQWVVALMLTLPVLASENQLLNVDTRPGVSVQMYYMKSAAATATVMLLPGGAGGLGVQDGIPQSSNFLTRSRELFTAHGFNVALMGRPSDKEELDFSFRVSAKHVEDLRRVASFLKHDTGLPVWLVGTSRGSVSAAAAAVAFGNEELAGVVFTSSVTSIKKPGAVPYQPLEAIRIPALVLHHQRDACSVCSPQDALRIARGLKNAPVKKEIFVDGGGSPSGDPCEALHWHGFIGMEKEAVDIIAGWIENPQP